MELPQFAYSILASLIASVIFSIALKYHLKQWKNIALKTSLIAVIMVVGTPVVYGSISIVKSVGEYLEQDKLQETINRYIKGNYPEAYERGYRLNVMQLKPGVILEVIYPEKQFYPEYHPLNNRHVANEIQKLANNLGYPGRPFWAYKLRALSQEELTEMWQQR